MSSQITMYSADWCGDCRRSKRLLDSLNVEYTIIDVEADASASEKVIEINGGQRSIPVIVFSDGTHLTFCVIGYPFTNRLSSFEVS